MKYRPRRYLTNVAVNVRVGHDVTRARLHDVSPHGARLIGTIDHSSETLEIEHLNTKFTARLCWQRDNSYGVIFKSPLPPAKLAALRSKGRSRHAAR